MSFYRINAFRIECEAIINGHLCGEWASITRDGKITKQIAKEDAEANGWTFYTGRGFGRGGSWFCPSCSEGQDALNDDKEYHDANPE